MSYGIGETRRTTCSVLFFWSSFVCSVNRRFQIKVSIVPAPLHISTIIDAANDPVIAYSNYQRIFDILLIRSALPTDARWIAASILKTERYYLRHYTDATVHLAPLGNAQQYCSILNSQLVFRGFFFSSPRIAYERRLTRCLNRQCAL